MNVFDDILRNIELQPVMLRRAAVKADPRRFTGDPVTAFGDIGTVGSERYREVWEEENSDFLREEREQRIARGD